MIHTRSVKLVNAIANHPSVRSTIEKGDHRIDSSLLLADLDNVVMADANGLVIFIPQGQGVYAIHAGFLPHGRGKVMIQSVRSAIEAIFGRFGAHKIVAAVPLQLRAARMACRLLGFSSMGMGPEQMTEIFVLEGAVNGRSH